MSIPGMEIPGMERATVTCKRPRAAFTAPIVVLLAGLAPPCGADGLVLEPFKPGGIYAVGERVGWRVTATERDTGGEYVYTIFRNGLEEIAGGRFEASGPATIEVTVDEPAMLRLEVRPAGSADDVQSAGAAVSPERLRPSAPEPPDFDLFWTEKIRALGKVAPNPVLTAKPSGRDGIEYYTLRMDHLGDRHIHGQLARPEGRRKLPGLVIFQWAGGPYPLQKEWVTGRAAQGWLALNIQPHDVLPDAPQSYYDALPKELKEYHTIGRDDRERSYFLQMYLAAYRAVDYLAGRPDWDGRTLVVMGTSMGGQQGLCAAALHPKVTAVIAHMPAGADVLGPLHGRASGYPNWPTNDPRVVKTAQYFDTVHCASRVRVPSLISMGFRDTVTPPAGIWIAFNQIRGPKEAVPLTDAAHNHQSTPEQQAAFTKRAEEWLGTLAAGGQLFEPADRPSPRLDENSRIAHRQLLKKKTQGRIDLYFLGDSITRRWGAAEPMYAHLLANWKRNFHGWNAANFGWGGDRTQNILWRLTHGELDGVHPKVIVLMAGTNNVGYVTPVGDDEERIADITRGIRAIVNLCREKAPEATIILMGITPRSDNLAVMPTIERINANLARLADGVRIRYLDINDRLADARGVLYPGMTDPDGLHLTERAYQIWADALRPLLMELLGPPSEVDLAPPPTGDPSAMGRSAGR